MCNCNSDTQTDATIIDVEPSFEITLLGDALSQAESLVGVLMYDENRAATNIVEVIQALLAFSKAAEGNDVLLEDDNYFTQRVHFWVNSYPGN